MKSGDLPEDGMETTRNVPCDQWEGCYDDGWRGLITDNSYAHPAKFSYGLVRRILEHLRDEGWIKPGSLILDPFGGVACGGIVAAYAGYRWIGCELESRFVSLAQANIDLHRARWERAGDPIPQILCGDSRKLTELLREAEVIVSSPPYAGSAPEKNGSGIDKTKQWETYRAAGGGMSLDAFVAQQERHSQGYGTTPGQLGSMNAGSVDAVLSSPPYAATNVDTASGLQSIDRDKLTPGSLTAGSKSQEAAYGDSEGQLGKMPAGSLGEVEAILSSPPYEGSLECHEDALANMQRRLAAKGVTRKESGIMRQKPDGCMSGYQQYTEGKGSLGNSTGPTFWEAAREIVAQSFAVLRPGGHAVWVTKNFCRNGAIVDFTGDWIRLCQSVGFRLVCRHRASLVKETTEGDLFAGSTTKRKERKSFFRRLHERKRPDLAIDAEDVTCFVK
jgi:hypothetical protein